MFKIIFFFTVALVLWIVFNSYLIITGSKLLIGVLGCVAIGGFIGFLNRK